jgi:Thioredoxin like C-terminal domain
MRVEFSIALDSDYGVWSAFANRYWPAVYLAEAVGRIRYHHFGEGEYDEGEWMIQHLLREAVARASITSSSLSHPTDSRRKPTGRTCALPRPTSATRRGRTSTLPRASRTTSPRSYVVPVSLQLNTWAMAGNWTIEGRASVLNEAGGRIAFRFHARDIHPVLCSRAGTAVPFRVLGRRRSPRRSPWAGRRRGGRGTKIDTLTAWWETHLHSEAEQAALRYTEALTRAADTDADQAFQRLHDGVARHFDAEEILEIMESS